MSIYQRLGGDAAISALIESLYVRALADPLISPFIENIDVPRLKAHQFAFISQAIGGPHPYPGPSLVQAHARLPIEQCHFDAFVAHLQGALQELEAADDVTAEIMAQVLPLSSVIVNTPSGAAAAR